MANLDRGILFKQIDRLYRDGTFSAQTDRQLLDRFVVDRDEAAFESLVNLHGPMVLSLCRRFLRDPRDIEDAFQATFLILARKADSIRNREVLSSWLYGVAYRVAVRSRSHLLRRRSVETGVPLLEVPDASLPGSVDEVGPALDQELSRLPEKYRAPIVLCYLKEQTHDQAAAQLQWPVGTVRSRLARGRELLKQRLTRRGYAPASALLGLGPELAMRSFPSMVPQALVRATAAAAGRSLWGATTGAGPAALASSLSGSAATLAQGVLTTMAFSQFKFIGIGLAALGVLAGGAGALALGSARPGEPGDQPAASRRSLWRKRMSNRYGPPPPTSDLSNARSDVPPASPGGSLEERFNQLERKLDLLLNLMQKPRAGASCPSLALLDSRGSLAASPDSASTWRRSITTARRPACRLALACAFIRREADAGRLAHSSDCIRREADAGRLAHSMPTRHPPTLRPTPVALPSPDSSPALLPTPETILPDRPSVADQPVVLPEPHHEPPLPADDRAFAGLAPAERNPGGDASPDARWG